MVTLSEDEKEPVTRFPIWRIFLISLISYIGYGLLGGWCLLVEIQHEEEYEARVKDALDSTYFRLHEKGPILELRAAYGLIAFSIIRVLTLIPFLFENDSNGDNISTLWLSISTLLMMVAFFTAFLNLSVFYLIHPFFLTSFFILIGLDFLTNISVLIRNSPLY